MQERALALLNRENLTILCYGVLQKEKEATVNSNSMFSVGSISKVGNAFVILKLVEEGILDLDTDVNTYLKDWKVINSKYNVDNPVTLRTILSHTAGFSGHGFGNYYPNEELPNTIQILEGKSPAKNDKVALIYPVGTEHKYSGGGITVSQKIIEDVTEMEYEQAAFKFLFEPLGLRRTTYENPLPQSFGNIAKAHNENGSPEAFPIGYQSMPEKAAAGLWTAPKDLYLLMEILMNDDNEFISKSLKEDMISREENSGFGLGPYIDYVEGEKVVVHNGLNDSYAANFTVS